jgi:hypothetical protein
MYFWLLTLALLFYSACLAFAEPLSITVQLPATLTLTKLLVAYGVFGGLVIGGYTFLEKIDDVAERAQQHRLYTEAHQNQEALQIAVRVLGQFRSSLGLNYALAPSSAVGLAFWLAPWPLEGGLSPLSLATTGAAAVLAFLVLYPVATIYLIYANASVALQSLPQAQFKVDLRSTDGRHEVGPVVDLVAGGVAFNVAFLFVVWVVGPSFVREASSASASAWWVVLYFVITYPIALMRVAQLRRLLRVRRALIASVKEAATATSRQRSETAKDSNSLPARVRTFPLITSHTKARLSAVVTVILIPLALMALDKLVMRYL